MRIPGKSWKAKYGGQSEGCSRVLAVKLKCYFEEFKEILKLDIELTKDN